MPSPTCWAGSFSHTEWLVSLPLRSCSLCIPSDPMQKGSYAVWLTCFSSVDTYTWRVCWRALRLILFQEEIVVLSP